MTITPELQTEILKALLMLVPLAGGLIGAVLRKLTRDANAAADYRRLILEELGINPTQTQWDKKTRKIDVARRSSDRFKDSGSVDPQPLDSQGGKGG